MKELITKLNEIIKDTPEDKRFEAMGRYVIPVLITSFNLPNDLAEAIWRRAVETVRPSRKGNRYVTDLVTRVMDTAVIESAKIRVKNRMS